MSECSPAGRFGLFAVLLGIVLTTVFRMGVDSLIVIVLYLAGMILLYGLR